MCVRPLSFQSVFGDRECGCEYATLSWVWDKRVSEVSKPPRCYTHMAFTEGDSASRGSAQIKSCAFHMSVRKNIEMHVTPGRLPTDFVSCMRPPVQQISFHAYGLRIQASPEIKGSNKLKCTAHMFAHGLSIPSEMLTGAFQDVTPPQNQSVHLHPSGDRYLGAGS